MYDAFGYRIATEGLVQQGFGVMAGEVLRMKLIAKFELYALYQWQCCNAATTPSPEPLAAMLDITRN